MYITDARFAIIAMYSFSRTLHLEALPETLIYRSPSQQYILSVHEYDRPFVEELARHGTSRGRCSSLMDATYMDGAYERCLCHSYRWWYHT